MIRTKRYQELKEGLALCFAELDTHNGILTPEILVDTIFTIFEPFKMIPLNKYNTYIVPHIQRYIMRNNIIVIDDDDEYSEAIVKTTTEKIEDSPQHSEENVQIKNIPNPSFQTIMKPSFYPSLDTLTEEQANAKTAKDARLQRDRFASEATRIPVRKIKYNQALFKRFYARGYEKWCTLDHLYNKLVFQSYFYESKYKNQYAVYINGTDHGIFPTEEEAVKYGNDQEMDFPYTVNIFPTPTYTSHIEEKPILKTPSTDDPCIDECPSVKPSQNFIEKVVDQIDQNYNDMATALTTAHENMTKELFIKVQASTMHVFTKFDSHCGKIEETQNAFHSKIEETQNAFHSKIEETQNAFLKNLETLYAQQSTEIQEIHHTLQIQSEWIETLLYQIHHLQQLTSDNIQTESMEEPVKEQDDESIWSMITGIFCGRRAEHRKA
jgi:hypothetical protein